MTSRPIRQLRVLAAACVIGAATVAVTSPSSNALPAATPPFVSLQGEGAWSIAQELVSWQNELATASSSIDLNYVTNGSFLGREDFVANQADFAISGAPFTGDELKHVPGGAAGLIDAPIQVAALSTFVEPPEGGFVSTQTVCDPDDPTTWPNYPADPPPTFDPTVDCFIRKPYTGAVRIPNRNLAAMYLHLALTSPALNAWNNPDVLKAFGVPGLVTPLPNSGPGVAGRSDPDEINFYLQTFLKSVAPDVWNANKQATSAYPWDPITERMGPLPGITRNGAEQQLDQLASAGCGVIGVCSGEEGGVAAAPPSMVKETFSLAFQGQPHPIVQAQMQNANGDWIAPSVDAINKGVDAGGDAPLYALTNPVPGAYPLVWVDHLYAPAHGLSIEKTEGLATLIRYLATTGQEKAASVGEGRLPPALVAKALAAANNLVVSNCLGNDRHVVSDTDPGPHAPASATAMKSIGNMLHCETVPATTTSTTTVTTTSTRSNAGSLSSGGTSGAFDNSAVVSSSAAAASAAIDSGSGPAGTGASGTGGANDVGGAATRRGARGTALLVANHLPLPIPTGTTGTDRLATFLVGAGLFLVLRTPLSRLARRVVA